MPRKHDWEILQDEIWAELEGDAKAIVGELFPENMPDAKNLSKPAYLDLVRRNWPDPQFRVRMLERLAPKDTEGQRDYDGLRAYIDTVHEAFGVPKQEKPSGAALLSEYTEL